MENVDKSDLLGKPKTSGYSPIDTRWWRHPRDLPLMTAPIVEQMLMEPTVRLGLAMRSAPLMNCQFAYKEPGSDDWKEGIKASSSVIGEFVLRQLKKIWRDIDALLISQIWGWSAAEVQYHLTEHKTVEVNRLLGRHPRDCRALIRDGEICGVRFLRLEAKNNADVYFPKSVFHAHNPQPGMHYGSQIVEGCYSPWWDKWGNGGALGVRRLTMQQNSINGRQGYYPDITLDIPDGTGGYKSVPARDIMRQGLEQMLAGGVAVWPSNTDEKGNRLWELKDATAMSGLSEVLQYPKDLDKEILRGLEIPDDVLSADNSGAWEGKKVPMMAFYNGLDRWLGSLVRDIDNCIIRHLVRLNFGDSAWYEIETKPLAEQSMEQAKPVQEQQAPQQAPQQRFSEPQPPQTRMSLDPVQAVGEGVMSAAELVKAARRVIRLATEDDEGHLHSEKDGKFTSKPDSEKKQVKQPPGNWEHKATHKSVNDLIADAVNNKESASQMNASYGVVSDDEAERIEKATGVDVNGYAHYVDGSTINHILEKHGESAALTTDELPVTAEDIQNISSIIGSADEITWLPPDKEKGRELAAIRYKKRVNGFYFVVEEIRTKKYRLSLGSIWKIKAVK